MCSGFLIGRVRDVSFIPLDAQLCVSRLLLIAMDCTYASRLVSS